MGIMIDTVRVHGFRGLSNMEIKLEPTTVLFGENNSGKTSLLKAIQVAFGNTSFLTKDDFYFDDNGTVEEIIIDVLIVPANGEESFEDGWEAVFTDKRIQFIEGQRGCVPFRTIVEYDKHKSVCTIKKRVLQGWPKYDEDGENAWYKIRAGEMTSFNFDAIPFYYIDAKRDIVEDMKFKTSFFGRVISQIDFSSETEKEIQKLIDELNNQTVDNSPVLKQLEKTLKEVTLLAGRGKGTLEITPFVKQLKDLNQNVSVTYNEHGAALPLDMHGMGTRSWSSLLTIKTLLSIQNTAAEESQNVFYPILCVEEPEAHLHPQAQKILYQQLADIPGQKIISTHSPYVAAQAKLYELRSIIHQDNKISIGYVSQDLFTDDDLAQIKQKVISLRGELLFAKVIVLFEGETEERALPIFAEKKLGLQRSLSVSYIGVGGHTAYMPFIRLAEAMHIPWLIFSDNDNLNKKNKETVSHKPKYVKDVLSESINKLGLNIDIEDKVVFLPEGEDFEIYLANEEFEKEVKNAIIKYRNIANEYHEKEVTCSVNGYKKDDLICQMKKNKTRMGELVASEMVNNNIIPEKPKELFEKVKVLLGDIDETD